MRIHLTRLEAPNDPVTLGQPFPIRIVLDGTGSGQVTLTCADQRYKLSLPAGAPATHAQVSVNGSRDVPATTVNVTLTGPDGDAVVAIDGHLGERHSTTVRLCAPTTTGTGGSSAAKVNS
jgi:hypothetical protein